MKEKTLKVLEYEKIIGRLSEYAASQLGKDLALNLEPIVELEDIERQQQETEEAVTIIMKRGNPPLGGIHDIKQQLRRADLGASLSPRGLIRVADSLRASRRLKGFIKDDKGDRHSRYDIIGGMIMNLNSYKPIEDAIFNAIISEEEISDHASPALRNIRRQQQTKNQAIRDKLNGIISSSTYKKYLQDAIITMRGDRYVVPVKQEHKGNFPGLVHDQSASGATLFIEPMAIVQLNNDLQELKAKERNEIERILSELTERVAEESEGIRHNQDILGHLDFIFAKAKFATALKAIKPILNKEGYIDIKKARHPMIDAKEVVPIDIYLGKDFTSLVVTGPNTGGKTVTLKTVGLLTLMAQSGLHIPADHGTKIAVFNQVFADIGDEQSIEQSLSTFSSHMTNIVDILKSLEENSLVLFDELGAGTDPTEGAALAMAILDDLYERGIRTLATTHYSELKVYAITTEGVENASMEFNVETLSPTYHLLIGIPGKSNAFDISKRLGLQDFIIERAKKLLTKESIQFEDLLSQIEKDKRISEANREESDRLKREIEALKEDLDRKKEKIENAKHKAIREAKEEARKILRDAKQEADEVVKGLRDISSEIEKERNKEIQAAKDRLKKKIDHVESGLSERILTKKNKKPPKNLKPGDAVKILSLDQKGTVITKPDGDGNVMVQVGIMKVNMHLSNLQRSKDDDAVKSQVATKGIMRTKSMAIKNELDLRGKTLEEALLDVDKYLDDAYVAGLTQVTIIHGKGTGVLRSGIHQLMKKHRHVKRHRLGEYGEGGNGVTVVDLK